MLRGKNNVSLSALLVREEKMEDKKKVDKDALERERKLRYEFVYGDGCPLL